MQFNATSRRISLHIFIHIFLLGQLTLYSEAIVSTEIDPIYHRQKKPSGRFTPESFVLGKGVILNNGITDESLLSLSFDEIGQLIVPALRNLDYYQAEDVKRADLLIVVSWGKTVPNSDLNENLFDKSRSISSDNYFLILQAYDFQKMLLKKQMNRTWVTRISMNSDNQSFDQLVADLAQGASNCLALNLDQQFLQKNEAVVESNKTQEIENCI